MIAGYALSNIVIYSIVCIKLSYYRNEKMDLFVRSTPGISDTLINALESLEIFENIFLVEMPAVSFKNKKKVFAPIRGMQYYKLYKKEFDARLNEHAKGKYYDLFFCPYLTNDSIFYIDFFAKINVNMKVNFVFEGLMSLGIENKRLCSAFHNAHVRNEKLRRFFTLYRLISKHKKRVSSIQYLFGNRKYVEEPGVSAVPMEPFTNHSKSSLIYKELFIPNELTLYYEKRYIYFFVSYPTMQYLDYEFRFMLQLEELLSVVSQNKCIVRLHPNNTAFKTKLNDKFKDLPFVDLLKLFVDQSELDIEPILFNIGLDKKIIIADFSSTCVIPKLMFDKEPFVICTTKLGRNYYKDSTYREDFKRFEEYFFDIYTDKTRIYMPSTIREFSKNVSEAYNRALSIQS